MTSRATAGTTVPGRLNRILVKLLGLALGIAFIYWILSPASGWVGRFLLRLFIGFSGADE